MPKPPIAAWNRSGSDSRVQCTVSPRGVSRSNDFTHSPNEPSAKLFLPWMFIAAAPPIETAIVPLTTLGQ
jgi:hypothetical protein